MNGLSTYILQTILKIEEIIVVYCLSDHFMRCCCNC